MNERTYFDNYAKTWDTEKRINRAKVIASEISKSIEGNKHYSVMEFGCGTGLISFNLYNIFDQIALVDSSKGMIDIVNTKIDAYKVNHMKAYHADILSENSENSLDMKFNIIYNSMVLHHIKDTSAVINRLSRLLYPEGYLIIVDLDEEDGSFHKDYPDFDGHNGFNQEILKETLQNNGFYDIHSRTFYQDEKMIGDQKVNYSLFIATARKN